MKIVRELFLTSCANLLVREKSFQKRKKELKQETNSLPS